MPFFMLYNYGAAILRAVGDTKDSAAEIPEE
jgi:Na+-driven multidrug efflux pump